MRTSSFMRRLRTKLSDAQANRLRAQLDAERDRARRLEERLAELQGANEGHYRTQYEATGGPQFDPAQPFGALPAQADDASALPDGEQEFADQTATAWRARA